MKKFKENKFYILITLMPDASLYLPKQNNILTSWSSVQLSYHVNKTTVQEYIFVLSGLENPFVLEGNFDSCSNLKNSEVQRKDENIFFFSSAFFHQFFNFCRSCAGDRAWKALKEVYIYPVVDKHRLRKKKIYPEVCFMKHI